VFRLIWKVGGKRAAHYKAEADTKQTLIDEIRSSANVWYETAEACEKEKIQCVENIMIYHGHMTLRRQ